MQGSRTIPGQPAVDLCDHLLPQRGVVRSAEDGPFGARPVAAPPHRRDHPSGRLLRHAAYQAPVGGLLVQRAQGQDHQSQQEGGTHQSEVAG